MSLIQSIEKSLLAIMEDKMREFGRLNSMNDEQINGTLERMDLLKSISMPLALRKSATGLVEKGKVKKDKKSISISLPFNKECVDSELCGGLEYNQGLFTQCKSVHLEKGMYCASCGEEATKSDNGMPSCGTVADRLEKGLMEFRDPKGRAPVSYLNYLKKKNSSVEEANRIAEEKGITIDAEHFVEKRGRPKKVIEESSVAKSEKRGRPKKPVVEVKSMQVIDLFASSVEEILENSSVSSLESESESRDTEKGSNNVTGEDDNSVSDSASASIDENQVLESNTKKDKKEKKTKEDKESKEQEKLAKKLALEQEKEAKKLALEQEKLAKEQEKEAKKKALEQEKEAKKLAKESKEQEKASKKSNKKEETSSSSSSAPAPAVEEVPAKVQVEEFKFEGVTYWRSSENLLYNPSTQECVGTWCVSKNTILPPPEESDDELEEEEYDEEDDERND